MSGHATADPPEARETILVTGLAGNVGRSMAPHLSRSKLIGVDLYTAELDHPDFVFEKLDVSAAEAPARLAELIRRHHVTQVYHLAFVLDPWRTGALTTRRQWEINVRGTQHLLSAIEEVNSKARQVEHMLYLSSVTSYGPDLPGPVDESYPQNPHTYTYALHKKETDELCRHTHPRLNGCAMTIVRGHIFLGAGVQNFIANALNGRSNPHRALGRWWARRGWKLPLVLPAGKKYRGAFKFMHIDDAARVVARLSEIYSPGELNILNLQGRGAATSGDDIARLAGLRMVRLPSYGLVALLYQISWALGISAVPPDALPYFCGSYFMDTTKLESLLGPDYPKMVRMTSAECILETVGKAGATTTPAAD